MIFINIVGFVLMFLIAWWFWFYQPESSSQGTEFHILVEHGAYQPALVSIPASTPSTLLFKRLDDSPCASQVHLNDLEIHLDLPLNKEVALNLPPLSQGEYPFHCQMNMIQGLIIVS